MEAPILKCAYDLSRNLISKTEPNGNESAYEYDALDRLISVTEANGAEYQYHYNLLGRITGLNVLEGRS